MAQYTIRQVAEMFRMPTSTLRYYEEEGILTNVEKKQKRSENLYRRASEPASHHLLL